jgi:hypothetical protein
MRISNGHIPAPQSSGLVKANVLTLPVVAWQQGTRFKFGVAAVASIKAGLFPELRRLLHQLHLPHLLPREHLPQLRLLLLLLLRPVALALPARHLLALGLLRLATHTGCKLSLIWELPLSMPILPLIKSIAASRTTEPLGMVSPMTLLPSTPPLQIKIVAVTDAPTAPPALPLQSSTSRQVRLESVSHRADT